MSRQPLQIRQAKSDESEKILAWGLETCHVDAMLSPQTMMLCVHNGKPVTFACVQAVGVISGVASDPEAWDGERALALKRLVLDIHKLFDEVVFYTNDPNDAQLEKIAERHGFEQLPWKIWRLNPEKVKRHG